MSQHKEGHIHGPASLALYLTNFSALMILTVLTIWAGMQDFGALNTPIALGIATVKAVLVVLFFMHVLHSSPLTKLTIFGSLVFLAILILETLGDYLTRGYTGGLS